VPLYAKACFLLQASRHNALLLTNIADEVSWAKGAIEFVGMVIGPQA